MNDFLPSVDERITMVQNAIANVKREIYACRLNSKAHQSIGNVDRMVQEQEKEQEFLLVLTAMQEELRSLEAEKSTAEEV